MRQKAGALNGVIDELRDAAQGTQEPEVSVGDLIDALDERGYGPALAILPLIELTPIGGIPGFPTALALVLATLTIRLMLGYEHFWAPGWIRRRKLKVQRVEDSLKWLKPVAKRVDAKLHERLRHFTGAAAQRAACILILVLLAAVPPLELVPFATSGPMIVISLFGLAILFRDGLLMLIAIVGTGMVLVGGAVLAFGNGGGG